MNEATEILRHIIVRREYLRAQRYRINEELRNSQEEFDAQQERFMQAIEHLIALTTDIRTLVFRDAYDYILGGNPFLFQGEESSVLRTRERGQMLSQTYWTVYHPNLTDDDGSNSYRAHYRINKRTFDKLVNLMANNVSYLGSQTTGGYPVYMQVACVLWRFANCHFGYRMANVHLGVTHGSYNHFTNRFIDAMSESCHHFLKWPTTPEIIQTASDGFKEFANLENCIGAVDGKLVIIQKPSVNGDQWIDRKNNASMSLMAVCDHQKRFTFLRVGHSGRNHDARVFTASELYDDIINCPEIRFPNDTYIVADSAYPISPQVIVPYPSRSEDQEERNFNRDHSATRIVIENAFALLVNRWRFLYKHLYMLDIERIAKTIFAACLLHNLCISMNDEEVTDSAPELLAEELGRVEEEAPVELRRAMPTAANESNSRSRNNNRSERANRRNEGIARRDQIKRQLSVNRQSGRPT